LIQLILLVEVGSMMLKEQKELRGSSGPSYQMLGIEALGVWQQRCSSFKEHLSNGNRPMLACQVQWYMV
jgi:hypothetical protein